MWPAAHRTTSVSWRLHSRYEGTTSASRVAPAKRPVSVLPRETPPRAPSARVLNCGRVPEPPAWAGGHRGWPAWPHNPNLPAEDHQSRRTEADTSLRVRVSRGCWSVVAVVYLAGRPAPRASRQLLVGCASGERTGGGGAAGVTLERRQWGGPWQVLGMMGAQAVVAYDWGPRYRRRSPVGTRVARLALIVKSVSCRLSPSRQRCWGAGSVAPNRLHCPRVLFTLVESSCACHSAAAAWSWLYQRPPSGFQGCCVRVVAPPKLQSMSTPPSVLVPVPTVPTLVPSPCACKHLLLAL